MLSRYDKALCSDALAKGSSLWIQTDGSSALPTESSLLAIGTESTATSKKPGHFTKTSSISLQYLQPHLQPSSAVSTSRLPHLGFQGASRLPNPGFPGAALKPLQGKKIKMFLNFISRLPGIFSPQRKWNERDIFINLLQSKIKAATAAIRQLSLE